MHHEESYMQKIVVSYVRNKHPEIIFTCAPAVANTARTGRNNKLMGYQAGWPDLFFALARKGYYGLAIELKTAKGKVSEYQKHVNATMNANGYKAVICYSAEEAILTIDQYLKG